MTTQQGNTKLKYLKIFLLGVFITSIQIQVFGDTYKPYSPLEVEFQKKLNRLYFFSPSPQLFVKVNRINISDNSKEDIEKYEENKNNFISDVLENWETVSPLLKKLQLSVIEINSNIMSTALLGEYKDRYGNWSSLKHFYYLNNEYGNWSWEGYLSGVHISIRDYKGIEEFIQLLKLYNAIYKTVKKEKRDIEIQFLKDNVDNFDKVIDAFPRILRIFLNNKFFLSFADARSSYIKSGTSFYNPQKDSISLDVVYDMRLIEMVLNPDISDSDIFKSISKKLLKLKTPVRR